MDEAMIERTARRLCEIRDEAPQFALRRIMAEVRAHMQVEQAIRETTEAVLTDGGVMMVNGAETPVKYVSAYKERLDAETRKLDRMEEALNARKS